MNTSLLKLACVCLFGFIFFLSSQGEIASPTHQLLSQEQIDKSKQPTVVISVDAPYSSVTNYETRNGFQNDSFNK